MGLKSLEDRVARAGLLPSPKSPFPQVASFPSLPSHGLQLHTVCFDSQHQPLCDQTLTKTPSSSKVKVEVLVVKSGLTLCNPMHCSPPGSSVHGILQARILEWVASIPWKIQGSS